MRLDYSVHVSFNIVHTPASSTYISQIDLFKAKALEKSYVRTLLYVIPKPSDVRGTNEMEAGEDEQ